MMKYFLLSIAMLGMAAFAFANGENQFLSKTLGFSVEKPHDWHFISAEENLENISRTELEDEEFQQLILKYSTAPLVAMTRYREPYDDLNPSFKVNVRSFGQLDPGKPKAILELVLPQLRNVFNDFHVVIGPTDSTVAGIDSAYTQISYSLKIPDGREFPTTSELWIVPHGSYFFMIGAGTRTDEKTGQREQISRILNTISIGK